MTDQRRTSSSGPGRRVSAALAHATPAILAASLVLARPAIARASQPPAPGDGAVAAQGGPAVDELEGDADAGLGEALASPYRWTVRAEASYWYAAPRGDITLPSTVGDVSLGGTVFSADSDVDLSDIDADDPASAALGRLHISHGAWRFSLGAAALGSSSDGLSGTSGRVGDAFFAPGDRLDADFDFWAIEGTAGYAIFHGPGPGERGDPTRLRYMLELFAGARVERVEFSLDIEPGGSPRPPELGLSASGEEVFAQPIGGARLTLDLFEDVSIEVGGSVGYFTWSDVQTTSTWDVQAAISWRPIEHVGVQFGYRFLGLSGEADEDGGDAFEYRGSSAGLFAGLVVEF